MGREGLHGICRGDLLIARDAGRRVRPPIMVVPARHGPGSDEVPAGAMTAAFHFEPQVAIAVDVTHASDHPGGSKKISGDISLGGGPTISRGSANSPILFEKLLTTADAEKIPYVIEASPRYTGTDADAIHTARSGVATAVISIPNRYMHSPNEMIQMDDVENAAKLVAALVRSLGPESSFIPE